MTDGQDQLLPMRMLEPEPAAAVTLTDRQAEALRVIRERQPIKSDLLGAALHAFRLANGGRGHAADTFCDWCISEARSVGEALQRKGLARYVRGEGWVTSDFGTSDEVGKPEPSSQIGVGDDADWGGF